MNYKKGLSAAMLSAFVSLPALADIGNLYASGKVGGSRENVSSIDNTSLVYPLAIPYEGSEVQTVFAYGGAVGYRFNYFYVPVRIEADYTYRNNLSYNASPVYQTGTENLKSTLQSQSILGNLYFDIPIVKMFGVFVGGGGGLGFNRTTNTLYSGADTFNTNTDRNGVAWMATAGLSLIPIDWFAIDLSYRYTGLGAVRWTDFDTELTSNNFSAQELFLTFRFTLPSEERKPVYQPVPYKPKPEPVPQTKGPAYRPQTKAPAYEPVTKGAKARPVKGAVFEKPEKGATYNSSRATPVRKKGHTS